MFYLKDFPQNLCFWQNYVESPCILKRNLIMYLLFQVCLRSSFPFSVIVAPKRTYRSPHRIQTRVYGVQRGINDYYIERETVERILHLVQSGKL